MNLTLHLALKDIRRLRLALSVWTLSLGYLMFLSHAQPGAGVTRDFLQLNAILLVAVMGLWLVADIVQADHPTRDDAHWRTLPVPPWRLVVAKLALLAAVFVVVPLTGAALKNLAGEGKFFQFGAEYGLVALILGAVVFSLAATAACTRNVMHCLALWMVLLFLAGALASWVEGLLPSAKRPMFQQMDMLKSVVILAFSTAVGVAVLLNQYLRRRPASSLVLLGTGAVGCALIGVLWGCFHLYRS